MLFKLNNGCQIDVHSFEISCKCILDISDFHLIFDDFFDPRFDFVDSSFDFLDAWSDFSLPFLTFGLALD